MYPTTAQRVFLRRGKLVGPNDAEWHVGAWETDPPEWLTICGETTETLGPLHEVSADLPMMAPVCDRCNELQGATRSSE